ncbi:MAG TPA: M48 family metalloprotease, partial [Terriglobales bacterium]|nr:M48 family metalloprotease [Terriglobales bacterium]
QEAKLVGDMHKFTPMVETYVQNLKPDPELAAVPVSDSYFMGRLELDKRGLSNTSYLNKKGNGLMSRILDRLTDFYRMDYLPLGFMQLLMLNNNFDKDHYELVFERREFLGDVRTLIFNVKAKPRFKGPHFIGRIWVDDQEYHIVRINGTYEPQGRGSFFFHFDSWRMNMQPGLWLPAYVYTEETDTRYMMLRKLSMKGQTRLWGYDRKHSGRSDELTDIQVDTNEQVTDKSDNDPNDYSPVQSQHAWEREAEDNVLDRLERAGMLAPEGDVSKVLQTVVNNLEITNKLNIVPEVRCRVLLTTPLETFTVGHTIVISRGLLDVLPDEASLAMVLSHELAHIALGHRLDTRYAFADRSLFPDEKTFQKVTVNRSDYDEQQADQKAVALLKNSPYADKLASAALFLRELLDRSDELSALTTPHFGNRIVKKDELARFQALLQSAPQLQATNVQQIAALPLGSRIKVDPWDDHIDMKPMRPVPLYSARDKMPLEVTPVFLHLARFSGAADQNAQANTATGGEVANKQQ